MDQDLEEAQDSMEEKTEEEVPNKDQQKSEGPKNKSPYMIAFPGAIMKFACFKKHKMPVSSDTKLPEVKKDAFLEGPFGFGPLVFPNLQRFNNVNCFLAVYCMVVLAQGKLKEQGCSRVENSEVDKVHTHGGKGTVHYQA